MARAAAGRAEVVAKLPLALQLAAIAESQTEVIPTDLYDLTSSPLHAERLVAKLPLFATIGAESRAWALATLRTMTTKGRASAPLRLLVFLVLARSGVAVPERWERWVPVAGPTKLVDECIAALPVERHADVLAGALRRERDPVPLALALLARWPSAQLVGMVFALCKEHEQPIRAELPALEAIGKRHPIVRAAIAARMKNKPPPIELVVTRRVKPAELTRNHQANLVRIGTALDGKRLTAAQRLGPGAFESTGSLRGMWAVTELAAASGKPAYDVYSFLGSEGQVCKANTSKVVALITQDALECRDAKLLEALQLAGY